LGKNEMNRKKWKVRGKKGNAMKKIGTT